MKKFIAIIITLLISLCCLPFAAGCKFSEQFTLKQDEDGNSYYVFSCTGFTNKLKGEYVIPSEHDGVPVTEIAEQGLVMTGLSKLTVPASIKKIGAAAFAYNYSLTEVVFEEGIEIDEIAQGLFGYDRSLNTVNIPAGVKTIGIMSFFNCNGLEEITLPEGLTTIGEQAFTYSGLKEITVPASVCDIRTDDKTTFGIGRAAFHSCENLKTVKIEARIAEIPAGAFGACKSLETLYLPATLKKIGGAYYYNEKFVYGHAFHYNTALKDIYFRGTAAQWNAVTVENESVTEQTALYDNSAIINATMHYQTAE